MRNTLNAGDRRPPSRERAVYTMRLGQHERGVLQAAAGRRGLYLSEYIRAVALEAAQREITAAREDI